MNQKSHSDRFIKIFKAILPSPFSIAILLTIITLLLAQLLTKPADINHFDYFLKLTTSWQEGLWDNSGGGLYFAFQMMMILVLGHILALTPIVDLLIQKLIKYCNSTASSALVVAMSAIFMGLINWGLGLIFGAIIARKIGEKFARQNKPLNYGLVGGAAYATMMTWHGGLSGSATTKSMETGYIPEMMKNAGFVGDYPSQVPFNETIGSGLNILVAISCLIFIPLILYFIGKKQKNEAVPVFESLPQEITQSQVNQVEGAERIDFSKIFGMTLGTLFLALGIYLAANYEGSNSLEFIQLNYINFMFLGLSLLLHKTINNFSNALSNAISDVSGILIQFPFYFGILALMKVSGLIELFSTEMTHIATDYTLPFFTFLSAGLVNIFVPSGGGQWAIQGPIVIETSQQLGANLPKSILAMAYGDQWTNMLQPFWALPLLGITKLSPKKLIPYSFIVFLIGFVIFSLALLLF